MSYVSYAYSVVHFLGREKSKLAKGKDSDNILNKIHNDV
jgi:hypothetical protein